MKRFTLVFLALIVASFAAGNGCSVVPLAKKEELKKFLDLKFDLKSVPPEREEEFLSILEIFSAERRSDEFARRFMFSSANDARLDFSNSGMHGGGTVFFKKIDGVWKLSSKWYNA